MSLSVKKLIGPHIVAAGTVTLSGTTGVVEIPAPGMPGEAYDGNYAPDSVSNYSVILTSSTATAPYVSVALAAVASTNTWNFTITAGNNATVSWLVVKNGL